MASKKKKVVVDDISDKEIRNNKTRRKKLEEREDGDDDNNADKSFNLLTKESSKIITSPIIGKKEMENYSQTTQLNPYMFYEVLEMKKEMEKLKEANQDLKSSKRYKDYGKLTLVLFVALLNYSLVYCIFLTIIGLILDNTEFQINFLDIAATLQKLSLKKFVTMKE